MNKNILYLFVVSILSIFMVGCSITYAENEFESEDNEYLENDDSYNSPDSISGFWITENGTGSVLTNSGRFYFMNTLPRDQYYDDIQNGELIIHHEADEYVTEITNEVDKDNFHIYTFHVLNNDIDTKIYMIVLPNDDVYCIEESYPMNYTYNKENSTMSLLVGSNSATYNLSFNNNIMNMIVPETNESSTLVLRDDLKKILDYLG